MNAIAPVDIQTYTNGQKRHLLSLFAMGAVAPSRAARLYRPRLHEAVGENFSPVVVATLCDLGLCASFCSVRGEMSRTDYWLTPKGVIAAKAIQAAAGAAHG